MAKMQINVEFGRCSFQKEDQEYLDEKKSKSQEALPQEEEIIRTGSLYFDEHRIDTKHIPFMLTPYSVDMETLIKKLIDDWHIPLPRIVLFVISDTEDSPSHEYRKLSRKLVKGLLYALNTTEMWLCTDGLDHAFSRDIGKAFENELSRRVTLASSMQNINAAFPETALIGICRRDILTFADEFDEDNLYRAAEKETEVKRDINRRYGYFIVVEDTTETKKGILKFILNFAREMSKFGRIKSKVLDDEDTGVRSSETPVMALLLQGKITQIDLILGHLKSGLPLVIFEGSGGLADLLVYAYHQSTCRPEGINIAEYTEAVMKPQVSDRMHELYPDFTDYKISNLTEKIFDCIRYSKQHDQEFITVLDIQDIDYQSSHLPCCLLKALFKSQTSETIKDEQQMKKDLFLAMDWNSADVATEEVFDRDPSTRFEIDGETFFRALTKPQREDFVSLFLNRGFTVHTFLDSSNLLALFQNSLKREFFRAVVWESVLGFGTNVEISRSFLDSKLIILIEELTGIPSLINSYELDWNCRQIYDDRTAEEAERKAMAVLALWALLSYRVQLVKTLWKHSEQPIHLALACSIILKKLEAFVTDLSLKNEMEKESKEFSKMAVNVLTLCYDNVPCRALDLLNEKNRVWSFKALMELAAFAENKMFLAHPCCQKCLDSLFMGNIKIRDLPYGDITIPLWLKIVLSAFLIFPMYLWVRFEVPEKPTSPDDNNGKERPPSENNASLESMDQQVASSNQKKKSKEPGFFYKIYYMWSAPITKFWVCQIFYLLYLLCFSLAVIWPACGNVFLDFFTCLWTGVIVLDSIYHAYTLNIKYTSMPLVFKCLEISIMIIFLFCYAMGRLIWKNTFMSPYHAKVMLCLALLYFYYRLIFISLPISSELGPMLYRVKRMITVDFSSYMRVTILVILSNGFVIHAVIFPDYPLGWELIRRAFYNAIISFFLTPADDFGTPDSKCIRLKRGTNRLSFIGTPEGVCKIGRYIKYSCPNPGVWPYLFGVQYFIFLRLILVVMLFALFSNTTRKLEEEGMYIWKYQRYALVINFSNRLTLPPPLCIITYFYMFLKFLYKHLCKCLRRYVFKYSKMKAGGKEDDLYSLDKLDENDFRYWKSTAAQYDKQQKQEKAEEMTTKKRMERTKALAKVLNQQRRTLRDLGGNLNELQIEIKNAHQYLEGSGLQVSVRERLHAKNVPQIFSRISPYPNTMISRFPVSDSHVPWTINWTMYDPIAFTLPQEGFPPALRPHVDVDIQKKREKEGEEFIMPNFNWNVSTFSPAGICLDRQSWITDKSNNPFHYVLDSEDLPRNPVGRTGLKGRGCLPRWGPNHYIYAVITRWNDKEETFHKYLDVVLMKNNDDLSLLGGYVHTENRYEILCSLFQTETMWREAEDMINFFGEQKDTSPGRRKSIWKRFQKEDQEIEDIEDVTSEKIKLGYMDEEVNTDQAWCEAEVWHFHYNAKTIIEDKFKANTEWHILSEEILMKVPIGQAGIIHTTAKKMKAILEVI